MQAAIETLRIAAEVCETNTPINEAEGNTDQAELERKNAAEYRMAIAVLMVAVPGRSDSERHSDAAVKQPKHEERINLKPTMTSPQERAAEIDRLIQLADSWVVAAIHASCAIVTRWTSDAKPDEARATLRAALEAVLADAQRYLEVRQQVIDGTNQKLGFLVTDTGEVYDSFINAAIARRKSA